MKSFVSRKLVGFLLPSIRHKLIRKMVAVPADALDPSITVEVAHTETDLRSAFSLLHDCYAKINLTEAQPSGLRCNIFSLLPTTTTVVAKKRWPCDWYS